jgi:hypothetical protein
MEQGLGGHFIPMVVSSVVPVFHHCTKHGTGFPPVIRVGNVSWYIAGLVACVVVHHAGSGNFGSGFYGIWNLSDSVSLIEL